MKAPRQPQHICILDYWGLGDATMMTAFAQSCEAHAVKTTIVCKAASAELLRPSFPEFDYVIFDPPWTAFRGKYRLWLWPWKDLARVLLLLKRKRFTAAVSVRSDPRDQFLMWLLGIPRRIGFPTLFSRIFLTDRMAAPESARPVAEDWQAIQQRVFPGSAQYAPHLKIEKYGPPPHRSESLPRICLHMGARIPVRRWSPLKFRGLIAALRETFRFELVLIPDLDGYGAELADVSDAVLPSLTIGDMVREIGGSDLLLCNDSAPAHIADAANVPVVAIFGPTHPVRFRPFSSRNLVVIRDICPHRPCFDYCRFPEPYCLTRLEVREVWPEIRTHIENLIAAGQLPEHLRLGDDRGDSV